MTPTNFKSALVDMDDTLIYCSRYYEDALAQGAEFIQTHTGLIATEARHLINECDLAAVRAGRGWARDRFPRSFSAAYAAAATLQNRLIDQKVFERAYGIGESVFFAAYDLKDGAYDLLLTLRNLDYRIILLTKGDETVQRRKIALHNFDDYVSSIRIVPKKCNETLATILREERVDIGTSVMIGDSLKDDIAPAVHHGLTSFHLATDTYWKYNDAEVRPSFAARSLREIGALLATINPYDHAESTALGTGPILVKTMDAPGLY